MPNITKRFVIVTQTPEKSKQSAQCTRGQRKTQDRRETEKHGYKMRNIIKIKFGLIHFCSSVLFHILFL